MSRAVTSAEVMPPRVSSFFNIFFSLKQSLPFNAKLMVVCGMYGYDAPSPIPSFHSGNHYLHVADRMTANPSMA
jgi:hypothetical protein